MAGKVTIQQNPDNNVRDIIILQESIRQVADYAKKLNNSGLKREALVILIQESIGPRKIKREQVAAVLEAAEELGKMYLVK